ncbi:hypothetical protein MMC16_003950 [Acarospora aff. strigata]|nr:hypothetical protein [Acarospora aff. strigata]
MTTVNYRPRVFLDTQIGTEPAGRITIELFVDKTPKTCENFRALTTASHTPPSAANPLTYKLSPFHRIIDEFMIQGGDITKGDGTGGASIYGTELEDENIGWRAIDKAGLVCMANRGKGTNSSQFFITLAACEHLNAKHTVFGHVVQGQHVLERVARLKVDKNDRPLEDVLISHCGELERRKQFTANLTHLEADGDSAATSTSSRDRGRKRRRQSTNDDISRFTSRSRSRSRKHHHHHHREPPPPQSPPTASRTQTQHQHRRRSDLSLDGTLRGRTLTRSPSLPRQPTKPSIHTSASPPPRKRHHHHRSRSPSRSHSQKRTRIHLQSQHLRREHVRSRSRSHSKSISRSRRPRHEAYQDRYPYRADEEQIRREEVEREGGEGRYSDLLFAGDGEDREGEDDARWRWRRRMRRVREEDDGVRTSARMSTGRWEKENGKNGDGDGAGGVHVDVQFKGRGSMKYRERERERERERRW